jgi:hypothetical protein
MVSEYSKFMRFEKALLVSWLDYNTLTPSEITDPF